MTAIVQQFSAGPSREVGGWFVFTGEVKSPRSRPGDERKGAV